MLRAIIFFAGLLFSGYYLNAQQLLHTCILKDARFMTTDEMGNVYVVSADNSLVKFNNTGDSIAAYRSVNNGDISSVDAGNPLKILVFYSNYSKIVLLDRQLTEKNTVDLKKIGLFNINAIGSGADGSVWVYDNTSAQLKKIDEGLNILLSSNDLRSETGTAINPSLLMEKDNKVFIADTTKGIFVFDKYASYLNTLDMFPVKQLQIFNNTILYTTSDSLINYNLNTMKKSYILLPKENSFLQARLEKSFLYQLYRNRLEIYSL